MAGPHDFVAAHESGDTMYVDLRVVNQNGAEYVAIKLHEGVHIVQERHAEPIGKGGDIHWAPPFDACRIPRHLFE